MDDKLLKELLKNIQNQFRNRDEILLSGNSFQHISDVYSRILIQCLDENDYSFEVYEIFERCKYLISHYMFDKYYGNDLNRYDTKFLEFLKQVEAYVPQEEQSDITNLEKMELVKRALSKKQAIIQIEMIKKAYEETLKQVAEFGSIKLSHVSPVAPENIENGKFRTNWRLTQYETSIGDYFFASSENMESNTYCLSRGVGMIGLDKDAVLVNADTMNIEDGKVLLKKPTNIYYFDVKDFSPVVTLRRDSQGVPACCFGDEWITDREIELQGDSVEHQSISDVTQVIENNQVFTLLNPKILDDCPPFRSFEEGKGFLQEQISLGNIRYVNGEAGINVDEAFDKSRRMYLSKKMIDSSVNALEERKIGVIDFQNLKKFILNFIHKFTSRDEEK